MRTILLLLAPAVATAAPVQLTHQGRLIDANGDPINGEVSLTVTLWNAPSEGIVEWDDTFPGVAVDDGYFSVRLGSRDPLDTADLLGGSRYIQLAVDLVDIGGRTPLVDVPFASVAHSVALGPATVCDAAHAGTMRFQDGTFSGCDGVGWVAMSSEYGSELEPALSCAGIQARRPAADDGIYYVDPDPTDANAAIPVFCDMDGGWTMLAKFSDGSAEGAAALWYAGNSNPTNQAMLDRDVETAPYVNPLAGSWWSDAGFSEVRVELWDGTTLDRTITFNAAGATNANWFASSRITGVTGWTDLTTTQTYNVFGITDPSNIRDFYISHLHNGCPADIGWLVIPRNDSCDDWHDPSRGRILYSGESTRIDWTGSGSTVSSQARYASKMVILAR